MDLNAFCRAVDSCPDHITPVLGDLEELHRYVGLPVESSFSRDEAGKQLYRKIPQTFTSGHTLVLRRCRELREELIQRHVLDGQALDPYFSILEHMQDALRSAAPVAGDIQGDWTQAIRHAYDHVRLGDWSADSHRERLHARHFEVARAAKRLQESGYVLNRSGHFLSIEPASETRLVARVEQLTTEIGGLNVARRIFAQIAPLYDAVQERYHVVNRPQQARGGRPQIPFGYLLLLAAKHFLGSKPAKNTDENWRELIGLSTDYAAVLDVQEYAPGAFRSFDAFTLVPYLQALALYDTLFRIPQIRGSDVEKIARGVLREFDFDQKRGGGWSVNELLKISNALLEASQPHGPHWFDVPKLHAACPDLPPDVITRALEEVLCHPQTGANRNFSKPTDAPTSAPGGQEIGHNSYYRPLLSRDRKTYDPRADGTSIANRRQIPSDANAPQSRA